MPVLRVAHVWGNRLLDVRHLPAGDLRAFERLRAELEAEGTQVRLDYLEQVAPVRSETLDELDWRFAKWVTFGVLGLVALSALFALQSELGPALDESLTLRSLHYDKLAHSNVPVARVHENPVRSLKSLELRAEKISEARATRPLEAARAGLLGLLNDVGAAVIFKGGGFEGRIDNALGALRGNALGDASGAGGWSGRERNGRPGFLNGLPGGDLTVLGRRAGPVELELKERPHSVVTQSPVIEMSPGLERDVIAKIIARHLSEVRYCYERALPQLPHLAGKVAVLFTIDPSGSVSDANLSESTLSNESVESCVLSRVHRWKFPEPRAGATVSVNYPWVFRPAGDGE